MAAAAAAINRFALVARARASSKVTFSSATGAGCAAAGATPAQAAARARTQTRERRAALLMGSVELSRCLRHGAPCRRERPDDDIQHGDEEQVQDRRDEHAA